MTVAEGLGLWLDQLGQLVSCESPSSDLEATARCADVVDEIAEHHVGEAGERIVIDGRTHLRWTFGTPRVLLLGHFDTVWPMGTLARWPFAVDGPRATGPGVFDMKAGIVNLFTALGAHRRPEGVTVLLTSDEEIGSPSAADLVTETARGLESVLVLEPGVDRALKIARKGVGMFRVSVAGRAAHAGLEPERGVNATVEAARQVLAIAALAAPEHGTTVTPTVLTSGTTVNTVPANASIDVDVRAETVAEMQRVTDALLALQPDLDGATVHAEPVSVRPPLEPTASAGLFARAVEVSERLGLGGLEGVAVGGGSDGNLTAAAGAATLDGLGAVGGNAHADGEWIAVDETWQRGRLVAALLGELLEAR